MAIVLTGLAAAGSSIHWLARPHSVHHAVHGGVPDDSGKGAGRADRLLWALPALTILWTNLHGGFFVGIVIVGTYGAGELLGALVTRERDERAAQLAGVGAISGRGGRMRAGEPGESLRVPSAYPHLGVFPRSLCQ